MSIQKICFFQDRIQHWTKITIIALQNFYKLQIVQVYPTVLPIGGYELKVKYPYSYARTITIVTFFIELPRLVDSTTLQKAKL